MPENFNGGSAPESTPTTIPEIPVPPRITPRDNNPQNEGPYHENVIDTTVNVHSAPAQQSINLERESNYTVNQEIEDLVISVKKGTWEKSERAKDLSRRYGNKRFGWLNRFRHWSGGDDDYRLNPNTGRMDYHFENEVGRRVTNVVIKTGITAAYAMLFGTAFSLVRSATGLELSGEHINWLSSITGVSATALIGSLVGRGTSEVLRGTVGTEGVKRERLMLAREKYYQHARYLASLIEDPDPKPDEMSLMTPDQIAEYHSRRHAAIKDLVNYIYESEQNPVEFVFDEDNVPFIATDKSNENKTHENGEPIEPDEPGISTEENQPVADGQPDIGSRVRQTSNEVPTRVTLEKLAKDLEDTRKRWELFEEVLALVGGVSAGILGLLHAKARVATELTQRLLNGDVVRLDIDANGVYHGVQQTTDSLKHALHITKEFIFNYATETERLLAGVHGATVLPQPPLGAHILNESIGKMLSSINIEAARQAVSSALPGFLGLMTRFYQRKRTNDAQNADHEKAIADMKQEHENFRERHNPAPREVELQKYASEILQPYPETGQQWTYQDPKTGRWVDIKIDRIINQTHDVKIEYRTWNYDKGVYEVKEMSIDALLHQKNTKCIEFAKDQKKTSEEYDGKPKPIEPKVESGKPIETTPPTTPPKVEPEKSTETKPTEEEPKAEAPPTPSTGPEKKELTPEEILNHDYEFLDRNKKDKIKQRIELGNILTIRIESKKRNWEVSSEKGKIVLRNIWIDKKDSLQSDNKNLLEFRNIEDLQKWIDDNMAYRNVAVNKDELLKRHQERQQNQE